MENTITVLKINNLPYIYGNTPPDSVPIMIDIENKDIIHADIIKSVSEKIANGSKTISLNSGDVLYLSPKLTIPRDKLKVFADKENIKITRDPSKADYIIASSHTMDAIFESKSYYVSTIREIATLLRNTPVFKKECVDAIITEFTQQFPDEHVVYLTGNGVWRLCNMLPTYPKYVSIVLLREEKYKNIVEKMASENIIYDQESILSNINGDSIIIDKNIYTQLCDLFMSSDKDNTVLAMELISNCQYKESIAWLTLLFYKHSSRMEKSHTKTHVNFKSLMNYMGISSLRHAVRVDDCFDILLSKDLVTEENVQILSESILQDVSLSRYRHVRVNEICLSDEINKKLGRIVKYAHHD